MRIALIGYGKMGQLIHQIALERGHQVVCIVDPMHDAQCTMHDAQFRSADVAIEFTTPATAADNIQKAWAQGVPVVSGTTGWDIEELKVESHKNDELNRLRLNDELMDWQRGYKIQANGSSVQVVDEKGKVWLIWKSNFSVGVNVFFELNKVLAQALAQYKQYAPSITETHHIHKLDKPSGTAVTLREGIRPYLNPSLKGQDLQVPIESIREGEVAGIHTVTWDSEEDTITITHSAKSRRGFALGAVLAAEGIV